MLLIVFDGGCDKPHKNYRYKTPYELAYKPNIDYIARKSRLGFHIPVRRGIPVGSGLGHLLLFGYRIKDYPERGVLEALGLGIKIKENQFVYRINFCTVDDEFKIIDRRAGRNGKYLDKIIDDLNSILEKNPFGIEIKIYKGKEYRGVLVLEGDNYPKTNDPQENNKKIIFGNEVLDWIVKKVNEFLKNHEINKKRKNEGLLPINCIIARGGGKLKKVIPIKKKFGIKALGIADTPLYLGVARYVGFDIINLEDNKKIKYALENDKKYDLIFIHFKKTDSYGEDGNCKEKTKYIEKIDKYFYDLREYEDSIIITSDHCTPCYLKRHSGDPVLFALYNPNILGDDLDFNEKEGIKGSLGYFKTNELLKFALDEKGIGKIFKK